MSKGNRKWNFSNFTTQKKVENTFQIEGASGSLTPGRAVIDVTPSAFLQEAMVRGQNAALTTEKMASEALVYPVLNEASLLFQDSITLFSGERWSVQDEATPLNGVCDFLIGGLPRMLSPKAPVVCIVEAKKQDFDKGTWQCAAELYACKLNNEREKKTYPFYFGCVTTGEGWKFIKLDCENNLLIRDTFTYTLENLPRLLGAWKWVLDTQLAAAPEKNGGL